MTVSWLPSAGAATYNIYRSTTSGAEGNTPLVSGITTTNYTDATAVSGNSYYYEIVAVSSYSISSPRSIEVLASNAVDILSYHGSTLTSQGVNNQETQLTPGNLSTSSFGMDFATSITDVPNLDGIPTSTLNSSINYTAPDGQPYGEPLVKTGVSIATGQYSGTIRNVVFVANQLGSLFAIDADGGNVLWKDSFVYNAAGNPNPLNPTVPNGTTAIPGGFGTETNSQDISPWICIVGTPVIDAANNFIYLITNTRYVAGGPTGDQTNPHYLYTIHKINMSNGVDTSSVFADTTLGYSNPNNPTYTYNTGPYVVGTGEGSVTVNGQSRIYFNAVRQMVRPALEIYNGRVYMASASHGDNQPYHGWIITFDVSTLAINAVFNTTPNGVEGGIWSGGDGVVFDSQGNFYVMTGNGTFDGNFTTTNGVTTYSGLNSSGFPNLGDYGDAFIKLSLDPTTTATNQNTNGWGIKVDDYFTPQNNASLDSADEDLGSGGPMILPSSVGSTVHSNLLVGSGKEGKIYLLDTNNMGKFTYNDAGAVQEVGSAVNGVLSTPAYFNGRIYVSPGYGGNLASWTIANGQINTASKQQAPDSMAFPGSSPSISANGTQNGVVWVIDKGTGALRAYDAENLSSELWTSNLDQGRDALPGGSVKFSVATPVNGRVYAVSNNDLVVYGPPQPPTAPPAAPSGASAIATGASTISVSWTDNSTNEAGFAIERSPDGTNFTQVATVGVNVTTYVDTGLDPTTKYYYRVRAYNSFNGTSYTAYTNIVSATTLSIGSQQPVDLYHFDENTGTTANDSIGTNTGTLIGSPLPTWTAPGRVGTSDLTFSGNGQSNQTGESAVRLVSDLSPILGGTSSLDAWIKTTQTGNNTHWQAPAITGVEQAGAGNDINWGTLNAAGDIGIYVGDSGGVYSTMPVNDGNWHNIAITRNAATGVVQLYVDGALNGSGTFDTGSKTSAIQLIEALEDVANDGITQTGANYFNGQIDEVAIYNQVLDPAVIASLALPPPAPTNLAVTAASGTELDLNWTSNSPYASGYILQRQIGNGPWVSLPTLPSGTTSHDDTGLTPDTLYSYQVQAIDSAGGSAFSNVVSLTTPVPPPHPSNAVASDITTNQIYLTWTNNATNATGYRILRSNIGGEFVVITPPDGLPATATSYLDTGLAPGTEYDYHIQCYNIAGVSDFAGAHTGTIAMPPSPVSATSTGSDSVMLNWTPPAYDGDAQDLSYNIYRGTTSGGEGVTPIATNVTQSSFLDTAATGLVAGQQYYYEVTAVDLGGESVSSAEVTAIPTVMTAPTLVGSPVINGDNPNGLFNAPGQATAGRQRSMVEDVVYTFSSAVTIPNASAAFTVVGTGPNAGTAPATLTATAVPGSSSRQWAVTLTGGAAGTLGSIANGEYSITINASAVFAADDGVTQLGAGRADQFYRLFGDINGDETVNATDNLQFKQALTIYNPAFDSNADGSVTAADNLALKKDLTVAYFGDGFVPTI